MRYIVRHGTTEVKSMIREVLYKVDINTLHRNEDDKQIGMNDIARVRLRTLRHCWRTTAATAQPAHSSSSTRARI